MEALELIVDEGRPANAWRFFQLGHDLLTLLDELSEVPVAWQVTHLNSGSALATVAPPESEPEHAEVLRAAHAALSVVQEGGALSAEWTPDAARAARRFVEHGQPSEDEEDWVAPQLRLLGGTHSHSRQVNLTAELAQQLSNQQPFERSMPGSVRGTLVGLNVSHGNRASLRLPNRRIVRVGFDSALRTDLKDGLYQVVELTGLVKQDGDGRVFNVRADEVRVLTSPSVRWTDLFGIDPDYTEGMATDEWLEASRGEA